MRPRLSGSSDDRGCYPRAWGPPWHPSDHWYADNPVIRTRLEERARAFGLTDHEVIITRQAEEAVAEDDPLLGSLMRGDHSRSRSEGPLP